MNRKEKTILIAIVANLALVSLKYGLATLSGSLVLRASTWHSLSDVFISLFVLAGLFASRWETGKRSRISVIENVVALIVSGFIFYVAYDIFREVLLGSERPDLRNLWPVTVASLLTIAITYFIARYKEYVGRATDSPSLIASGFHSRMDLYASVLVVVSLAVSALGVGALDRIAAAVVIFFVIQAGWKIANSALQALLSGGLLHLQEESMDQVRRHSWRFARFTAGALVVFFLLSGFYAIQPEERGVVRRFGQVVADVGPGLHYRLPLVEQLDRLAVDQVRQVQTGTILMLTGDTNLIEVALGVHYNVTDAVAFLFNVNQMEQLVALAAEAAIRQAVAERGVDELLTTGRAAILKQTLAQTQALLDEHDTGVRVTDVQLLKVNPPAEVAATFRDVASAREDKNTYINEGQAYRNAIVPQARGEAENIVLSAQAEKQRRTDVATGEAERFVDKLLAYRDGPQVTRIRLYLEALEQVLPGVSRKFIIDPSVQIDTTDLWFVKGEQ